MPAEFLRAGYFPSISGPSTVRDEIAELLTLTDQERAEISAALHDTFKGFRKEFLAGARLLGEEGGGETQIQIKPVSSSRAASLHHEFESRLAGAVGKDRASIFRLFADKALRQKLADFGTEEQVVIIRDKNGMRYFDRYAIDPESGERRQSPLETGSWSLERDEEFRQTTDNQGTFFKRPLLELAGLW